MVNFDLFPEEEKNFPKPKPKPKQTFMEIEFRPRKVESSQLPRSRSKSPAAIMERIQIFYRKSRHRPTSRHLTYFEEKLQKVKPVNFVSV